MVAAKSGQTWLQVMTGWHHLGRKDLHWSRSLQVQRGATPPNEVVDCRMRARGSPLRALMSAERTLARVRLDPYGSSGRPIEEHATPVGAGRNLGHVCWQ